MKLSEALILRADYQKRLQQLEQRLARCVRIQEGETPPENPEDLIQEAENLLVLLGDIIKKINQTNSHTIFAEGLTIADALAERDILLMRSHLYQVGLDQASYTANRYSSSEIRLISTINIANTQRQKDDISRQYRELDTKIQAINWQTDLTE